MRRVRAEMGSEAIILHTRKIKQKGLKGLFAKPLVEVVAAVEERATLRENHREQEDIQKTLAFELRERQNKVQREQQQKEISDLKAQMSQLTDMMQNVIISVDQQRRSQSQQGAELLQKVQQNDPPKPAKPIRHHYFERLIDQQVDSALVDQLQTAVNDQTAGEQLSDDTIKQNLQAAIRNLLGEPYKIDQLTSQRRICFFVGPTGVGKTTTLAKIAAKLALVDNKKVGLVTADTYRIAAVDQLKTYSEILSIPIDVIYDPKEMTSVLKKHQDKDYILVDTAGRNHKDTDLHRDLQQILEQVEQADVFLVMSLTSSVQDIESILNSYAFLQDYKLIFTKLDEAATYGTLLNAKVASDKALSYITNGQSVPDDILIADANSVAELFLGDDHEWSSDAITRTY